MFGASTKTIPLIPVPSSDERDPLRWPRYVKIAALVSITFINFTANFAGAGLSVAIPVLMMQFRKTQNQINGLLTFNFLLLGIGNLFWVPIGIKYGKRASLLISLLLLFATLIWSAKETTFSGLMAARCVSGFAAAAGESIVPSAVSDMFFLHERAAMMSGYTILISSATALGPLLASFIIQYSKGGWVDYMWVCAGLAGGNLVAIYLCYPESTFHRPEQSGRYVQGADSRISAGVDTEKAQVTQVDNANAHHVDVVPKSWRSIWTSIFTINHKVNIFKTFVRPLQMLARPSVLFAVYVYGTTLASQVILIFAFPNLLMAPPYLFSGIGVGLMQIAAIVGFVIACFAGGWVADEVTAMVIRRQYGAVYPEQRLIALLPGCFIAPVGCIIIAFACSKQLSWVAIAFGFGMVSFGTVYAPNIAITYVVECYPAVAAECLVAINVFKNLVAFLFLYTAVDWVNSQGWVQVYMIMFMLVTVGMLLAIPLYFFGRRWR